MTAYQVGQIFGAFLAALLIVSVVFYVFKRRSISFRSVLTHKVVIVASLLGAVLNVFVRGLPAEPGEPVRAMTNDEMISFYAGCVDKGKARLDETAAKQHCACVISEIQNTFTSRQFRKLTEEIARTGEVNQGMVAIVRKCEVAPP